MCVCECEREREREREKEMEILLGDLKSYMSSRYINSNEAFSQSPDLADHRARIHQPQAISHESTQRIIISSEIVFL